MSTQQQRDALRERFEKRNAISGDHVFDSERNKYRVDDGLNWLDATDVAHINNAWRHYQSGAEDRQAEIDALQAKLDALMLEYCPDDMTEAQVKAWGDAQQPYPLFTTEAEEHLLAEIDELKRKLEDNQPALCLPAEELKELIYSIHGSHHVGDAQHTKLDIINAQIDSLFSKQCVVELLQDAIVAIAEDGYTSHGVEGMTEEQEKCHKAYLTIIASGATVKAGA